MAINDIVFVKGQGGLGRALPGEDYISGLLFYSNTYPSGFSASQKVRQIFSLSDAEAAGITNTYSDETKATATYLITTKGNTGDTINWTVTEPTPNGGTVSVNLGTYAVASADTTIALQGAAWAAGINAGTLIHGYTAAFNTATLTVTPPSGKGISLNSGTPVVITLTGAFAGTLTQFSGGVASKMILMHYHISEYFRIQPQGNLFVGVFPVPGSYTFSEISDMQNFANGKMRQCAVYNDVARTVTQVTTDLTAMQAIAEANDVLHYPLSIIYGPNIKAVADLSALKDLNSYTNPKTSVVISQDGAATGAALYIANGVSITNIGELIGAVSLAAVSEDIAWVEKFNISDGIECDTIAFSNGQLYSSLSSNLINQLDAYRYIFLRKFSGVTGSFFNDSHTAVALSSDYAYIENNRTIDKAIRGVYTGVIPKIASPITLNADGTMTDITIAALETAARTGLDPMVRAGELSAYSIIINPAQNVQATSKVIITVQLVGVAVARNFQINIGYVVSI